MPKGSLACTALEKEPERASEEEKEAANFLLRVALPCVEKDLNYPLKWRTGKSSWAIIGEHWHHSMALASVLMDFFSRLENVEGNNKPKLQENGKSNPELPTSSKSDQAKKCRRKMVSKQDLETTVCETYYRRSHRFCGFYDKEDHYKSILLHWDKESGRSTEGVRKQKAACRTSIQPDNQQKRKHDQEPTQFERYLQLAKIKTCNMPPLRKKENIPPQVQGGVTICDGGSPANLTPV